MPMELSMSEAARDVVRHASVSGGDWPREHRPKFLWTTFRPNRGPKDAVFAFCYAGSTVSPSSGNPHTCVLSVRRDPGSRTPVFAYHCGDTALTGKMDRPVYRESMAHAAVIARTDLVGASPVYERSLVRVASMAELSYATQPANTGCNFWSKINNGDVCKHLKDFFGRIPEWNSGMKPEKFLHAMEAEYRQWMGP